MPDISLCQNEECYRKDTCYRYIAEPSYRQSYGNFTEPCDMYIECKNKGQKKRLDIQCEY